MSINHLFVQSVVTKLASYVFPFSLLLIMEKNRKGYTPTAKRLIYLKRISKTNNLPRSEGVHNTHCKYEILHCISGLNYHIRLLAAAPVPQQYLSSAPRPPFPLGE
ncbi:hypothetical protein D3C84_1011340 [compost metagenome]